MYVRRPRMPCNLWERYNEPNMFMCERWAIDGMWWWSVVVWRRMRQNERRLFIDDEGTVAGICRDAGLGVGIRCRKWSKFGATVRLPFATVVVVIARAPLLLPREQPTMLVCVLHWRHRSVSSGRQWTASASENTRTMRSPMPAVLYRTYTHTHTHTVSHNHHHHHIRTHKVHLNHAACSSTK